MFSVSHTQRTKPEAELLKAVSDSCARLLSVAEAAEGLEAGRLPVGLAGTCGLALEACRIRGLQAEALS
jgi:hypothetical protein